MVLILGFAVLCQTLAEVRHSVSSRLHIFRCIRPRLALLRIGMCGIATSKCLTAGLNSDGVSEPTPFLAARQPLLSARIAEPRLVLTTEWNAAGIHSARPAMTTT